VNLLEELERKGVVLTPKLTYRCTAPLDAETLQLLRTHRDVLLSELVLSVTSSRLPWQLEALLRAAASDALPKATVTLPAGLVPDLSRYTLAWAASYLTGDRDEALVRLWEAQRAWKGVN
jgi:hypothetical protein